MSAVSLQNEVPAALYVHGREALLASKRRFDNALVRFDAWFLVFTAVIIAFGAALLGGLAIWCVVYQKKRFTGSWAYRDGGLKVFFECV